MEKAIIKAESAGATFEYKARDLSQTLSQSARDFVDTDHFRSPDFKISGLVAEQAGISQLESEAVQDQINARVLDRLKEIEEKAYREGFELGKIEGGERAYREAEGQLAERLSSFDGLLARVETLKNRLLVDNEGELVRLTFQIASKIATREVTENPGSVLPILRQVIGEMQEIERITVNVSPVDHAFIEDLRQRGDTSVEPLARTKVNVVESVSPGGCVIETDYGSVDATMDERIARAWASLEARVPKNLPEDGGA